jgi:hypothetical protein
MTQTLYGDMNKRNFKKDLHGLFVHLRPRKHPKCGTYRCVNRIQTGNPGEYLCTMVVWKDRAKEREPTKGLGCMVPV